MRSYLIGLLRVILNSRQPGFHWQQALRYSLSVLMCNNTVHVPLTLNNLFYIKCLFPFKITLLLTGEHWRYNLFLNPAPNYLLLSAEFTCTDAICPLIHPLISFPSLCIFTPVVLRVQITQPFFFFFCHPSEAYSVRRSPYGVREFTEKPCKVMNSIIIHVDIRQVTAADEYVYSSDAFK